jgi:DNA replication and repair protein RecF
MATASATRIRRLTLTNFRSYRAATLVIGSGPGVLIGPNGAGKTNLLEAISLLAPGRGLRRARLDEIAFAPRGAAMEPNNWAVAAEIEGTLGLVTLGTGIETASADDPVVRKYRIDGEPVSSAAAFAEHVRVIWLIPAMDGLFSGPASDRRRFLDRLVLAIDPEHASRVTALERSLRSRNRLLQQPDPDPHWLDALEHRTAELAVAVAAARVETVRRLKNVIDRGQANSLFASRFPRAAIRLDGVIENRVDARPAIEVEDRYRAVLREGRARDAAAGRTLAGPHLTDFTILHAPSGTAAAKASTGEQKALLIGLVLAHAGLIAEMTGFSPIVLLDEVLAHLDPWRRAALNDQLASLGAQVWMTGTDPAAFIDIAARAQVFEVRPGEVARSR